MGGHTQGGGSEVGLVKTPEWSDSSRGGGCIPALELDYPFSRKPGPGPCYSKENLGDLAYLHFVDLLFLGPDLCPRQPASLHSYKGFRLEAGSRLWLPSSGCQGPRAS